MNLTTISNTFTVFGNFSKIVLNDEGLKKAFEGYQVQEGEEQLPNGTVVKQYHFANLNKAVTIRAYRIDIQFGYNDDSCTESDFLKHAEDVAKLIAKIDDTKLTRIAFSNVEFVSDENKELFEALNNMFNVKNVFGTNATELSVRSNHVKEINGELCNSILSFQDGVVTNNKTQEKVKAIFFNKDINTVISNNNARFTFTSAIKLLADLVIEARTLTNTVLDKAQN